MIKTNKKWKTEDLPVPNLGLTEVFLIQVFLYALLWTISDYTATLLTIVLPVIFLFLLILAFVAELIDRSKTPAWYFKFMIISILVPILTALVFISLTGADFDWTKL